MANVQETTDRNPAMEVDDPADVAGGREPKGGES